LGLSISIIRKVLAANETTRVETRIGNFGSTPALNVKIVTRFEVVDSLPNAFPDLTKMTVGPRGKIPSQAILPPNQGVTGEGSDGMRMPPFELSQIKSGKKHLFYFALITYKDIWGEQHYTRVCAEYNHPNPVFLFSTKYNEIDREKYDIAKTP